MKLNSTNLLFLGTMIVGVMVSMCSNNWFMIWSGMEIMLMSFIPLISGFNIMSSECSLKYFIIQAITSSLLILGMIFNIVDILGGEIIMDVSILMKLGASPFHNWVLVVTEGLSYLNNFLLLTFMKIPSLVLMSYLNSIYDLPVMLCLMVGSIFTLNQSSIRKIFAYSSIFNLGFILSCVNYTSVWMSYLLVYSFILLNCVFFVSKMNMNYINQLLVNDFTIEIKIGLWIVLMSLSGIPPMVGFLGKLMILELIMCSNKYYLLFTMIVMSLIVTFYYIRLTFLSVMFSSLTFKWIKLNLIYYWMMWPILNLILIPFLIFIKTLI